MLNNLSVKHHLFTDKRSILSQLFTVIGFMVVSRTASRPMSFIGTLSQTLTLRALVLIPPSPFQGGDQGLRASHRRTATLPTDSGPASDDALLLLLDNGRTAA